MRIETQRLVVRDFLPDDAEGLHAILGDAETMRNCESAYTLEQTRAFLSDFCIGRKGALAAVDKASGALIGYILFKPIQANVYEMGWIFNRAWWRQGFAYEACAAVVDHAFGQLGAHKIFAEAIDPVKSLGLMKKLGMRLEGVQRAQTRNCDGEWVDLYLCGMLRKDWIAASQKT